MYAKNSFIIELDDNKELDILKSLIDPYVPEDIVILNTEFDLFNYKNIQIDPKDIHLITKVFRYVFDERDEYQINQAFNFIMQQAHLELLNSLVKQGLNPCILCSLKN